MWDFGLIFRNYFKRNLLPGDGSRIVIWWLDFNLVKSRTLKFRWA